MRRSVSKSAWEAQRNCQTRLNASKCRPKYHPLLRGCFPELNLTPKENLKKTKSSSKPRFSAPSGTRPRSGTCKVWGRRSRDPTPIRFVRQAGSLRVDWQSAPAFRFVNLKNHVEIRRIPPPVFPKINPVRRICHIPMNTHWIEMVRQIRPRHSKSNRILI